MAKRSWDCKFQSLITGMIYLTPEMIELRNVNQTLTLLTTEVAHIKLSYRSIAILETSTLRTFSKRLANHENWLICVILFPL